MFHILLICCFGMTFVCVFFPTRHQTFSSINIIEVHRKNSSNWKDVKQGFIAFHLKEAQRNTPHCVFPRAFWLWHERQMEDGDNCSHIQETPCRWPFFRLRYDSQRHSASKAARNVMLDIRFSTVVHRSQALRSTHGPPQPAILRYTTLRQCRRGCKSWYLSRCKPNVDIMHL